MSTATAAFETLSGASDHHRVVYRPATHAGELPCWVALPNQPRPHTPPLVAVHGIRRGAQEMAEAFAAAAARQGRVVIAPLFDEAAWPAYQQVVRGPRADTALIRLLRDVQAEGLANTRRFELFGYSGGAQFSHRFAMLHPLRLTALHVASAGWYTLPNQALVFPYGLAPSGKNDHAWEALFALQLDAFLALPMQVMVGALDSVVDEQTRSLPRLDAVQGADRLSRARHWLTAVERAARARGLAPRIRWACLPDADHNFMRCVREGGLVERVLPAPSQATSTSTST